MVQFACLLFPVAVVLQFLDTPAVRFLYETDNRLTLFPLILPFPVLLWRNMRIYTGERYRDDARLFTGRSMVSVRQRYRLRSLSARCLQSLPSCLPSCLKYGCSPFIMTAARPYPQATAIPQASMSRTGMTTATIPCRKAFTASSMKKAYRICGRAWQYPHRATLRFWLSFREREGESNRHGRTERKFPVRWGIPLLGKR